MKSFIIQFKRLFSVRLLLISMIFAVTHLLSIAGEIQDFGNTWYYLERSLDSGVTFFTMYFLPAMAFSYTLSDEWSSHASDYWVSRIGINRYTYSKFITSALGGFFTVFIGIILIVIVLSIIFPTFAGDSGSGPYGYLVSNGHILTGAFFYALDYSLSGAVSAVIGVFCSTFIMSPIVSVTAPLCIQMTLSLVSNIFELPKQFNALFWMHVYIDSFSLMDAVWEKYLPCILVMVVLSYIGVKETHKRTENR